MPRAAVPRWLAWGFQAAVFLVLCPQQPGLETFCQHEIYKEKRKSAIKKENAGLLRAGAGPRRHGPTSPDLGSAQGSSAVNSCWPHKVPGTVLIFEIKHSEETNQAGHGAHSPGGWGLLAGQFTMVSGQGHIWESVLAKSGLHVTNLLVSRLHRGCTGTGGALTPFCLLSF